MRFFPAACLTETFFGKGPGGTLMLGDFRQRAEELVHRFEGTVQTVYLDPPFNTGKEFVLRQRCGEAGWRDGKPVLQLPAYSDAWTDEAQLIEMLEAAAVTSRALLKKDGSFFMHIDSRLHARVRLMLDKVFGEKAFVNEIIWAYKSGGRSEQHFSRKHDIILFYRKSPRAYFNIAAVGVPRAQARSNHMRRAVDDMGRPYRAIISQGKEYRYYDDDLVYPGDVWDDVSHLQQKDPQRTGYDTQKPARLLERIIACSTRPGDLVCDLFSGSGTAPAVAAQMDRRFLALDASALAIAVTRKRLLGDAFRLEAPTQTGEPVLKGGMRKGIGFLEAWVDEYGLEAGLCPLSLAGDSALDQLSLGYVRGSVFYAYANAARSKLSPALPQALEVPMLDGQLAMLTVDVLGRRMLHLLEDDGT
ncbi:MAG TPA: site-specific DNA-methyltransferase [Candidatus Aphodomonas merdavium]|nr:site-specific DNA-methyltransferase [Candidatus Aphodomonas merdavium]